jgi:hypothetical protein
MTATPFDGDAPEVTSAEVALIPHTGELIDLADAAACADALDELLRLTRQVSEVQRALRAALVDFSQVQGARTFRAGSHTVTVGPDEEKLYDAEAIERDLREAGMPDDRIAEIVVPTVTLKVDAVKARQAGRANPAYADVIDRHTTIREKAPNVKVKP